MGIVGPNDAHAFARTQWHRHQIAGRKIETGRYPVGIGLVERNRDQNVDNPVHVLGLADSAPLRKGEESNVTLPP